MSLLDLNSGRGSSPRLKRGVKLWVGAGFVAAVVGIGSTLASSITINATSPSEFGQGVERIVYCGGDSQVLKVTPISAFKNLSGTTDSTAGNFYLSGIKVSGIPSDCDGVNFVMSIYKTDGTSTPLTLASGPKSATTLAVYWRDSSSIGSENIPKGTAASDAATISSTTTSNSANSTCQGFSSTGGNTLMGGSGQPTVGGLLSLDRFAYSSPCPVAYLTVNTSTKSFQVNFKTGGSITNTDIKDAGRIVIETQEDLFAKKTTGNESLKSSLNSSGYLGLAYDGLSS